MTKSDDDFKNNAAIMLADHSALLYALLEKCECGKPVTVVNGQKDMRQARKCDRCCAEEIVGATTVYINNPASNNARQLLSLMNEKEWIDVQNATSIRTVEAHVDAMQEGTRYIPSREKMH